MYLTRLETEEFFVSKHCFCLRLWAKYLAKMLFILYDMSITYKQKVLVLNTSRKIENILVQIYENIGNYTNLTLTFKEWNNPLIEVFFLYMRPSSR